MGLFLRQFCLFKALLTLPIKGRKKNRKKKNHKKNHLIKSLSLCSSCQRFVPASSERETVIPKPMTSTQSLGQHQHRVKHTALF